MKQFRRMTYPYIVWALILIVAPMLLIVLYAFTTKGNDVVTTKFTLENFARFFSDRLFLKVLLRSLKVAAITTIACLLLGYFPAYYIAKSSETFKMHWVLIITFPTWINLLVRTYAWIGILQDDGIINTVLGWIGLGPYKMMYTEFAVILGMVYNFLPFPAGDASAVPAGYHQRYHPRVPACGVELLYSQHARRRSVYAGR